MTQVILFHSILGLRPGVRALAARLSAAGHPTVAPDLYEGRSTGNVDEGFAIHREIGLPVILARARAALADLPPRTVLAGISAGAGAAGELWAERPEAAGVIFLSGPGPIPSPRPSAVPLQMHMARPDPFDSEEFVDEWRRGPDAEPLTVLRYDGVGHNFLDEGGPDWDAAAAALCEERVRAFLDALG